MGGVLPCSAEAIAAGEPATKLVPSPIEDSVSPPFEPEVGKGDGAGAGAAWAGGVLSLGGGTPLLAMSPQAQEDAAAVAVPWSSLPQSNETSEAGGQDVWQAARKSSQLAAGAEGVGVGGGAGDEGEELAGAEGLPPAQAHEDAIFVPEPWHWKSVCWPRGSQVAAHSAWRCLHSGLSS
jgi:hypothetical protein